MKNMKIKKISENINNELNRILEWRNINKLSINAKETIMVLFNYHQHNVNSLTPKLAINSEPIERVTECNFRGFTIDGHLSWTPHIQKISNKIFRTIRIMYWLKRFLLAHILKLMYTSLILQTSEITKKINSYNSKYNAHTNPLLRRLNLLQVKDIFMLNILKIYHKYRENSLPSFTANKFSVATCACNYNLGVTKKSYKC